MNDILRYCGVEIGPGRRYMDYERSVLQGSTRVFLVDYDKMTKGRILFVVRTP